MTSFLGTLLDDEADHATLLRCLKRKKKKRTYKREKKKWGVGAVSLDEKRKSPNPMGQSTCGGGSFRRAWRGEVRYCLYIFFV